MTEIDFKQIPRIIDGWILEQTLALAALRFRSLDEAIAAGHLGKHIAHAHHLVVITHSADTVFSWVTYSSESIYTLAIKQLTLANRSESELIFAWVLTDDDDINWLGESPCPF